MATRLLPVMLPGPAGPLEGALHLREGPEPTHAAVVCHPHPLYGGTLHNKVVHRVASTLHQLGLAVLRFNFRGVGRSAGAFDQGRGELDDARAAAAYLRHRFGDVRLWAAGFSFGSWVAARLAASDPEFERMILIAPTVGRNSFEVLKESDLPKLVIQGTDDDICPLPALQAELPLWREPKRLVLVEGASHFFDRRLGELGAALSRALGPAIRQPAA